MSTLPTVCIVGKLYGIIQMILWLGGQHKLTQECIPVWCILQWPSLLPCMPPTCPHHSQPPPCMPPCTPPGMHTPCHACPLPCTPPGTHAPCHALPHHTCPCHNLPCEQNHRCLWKHNLAATTLRTVITFHTFFTMFLDFINWMRGYIYGQITSLWIIWRLKSQQKVQQWCPKKLSSNFQSELKIVNLAKWKIDQWRHFA